MTTPSIQSPWPPCGLYRTRAALPGHEERVRAGMLVQFHGHSNSGEGAELLLPDHAVDNRWHFHGPAIAVSDPAWATEALAPLPPEGLYVLRRHIHAPDRTLPERCLVELGYDAQGRPILFVARWEDHAIQFPTKGYRFDDDSIFGDLDPVPFVLAPHETT